MRVLDSDTGREAKNAASMRLIEHAAANRDWDAHAKHRAALAMNNLGFSSHDVVSYCLITQALPLLRAKRRKDRDPKKAAEFLQAALALDRSTHLPRVHYLLGVAKFLAGEKDHAYYHWWHLLDTYPDHPLHLRAYVNLAAEALPFRITELNGYSGARQMVYRDGQSPPQSERKRTRKIYERLQKSGYPSAR